MSNFISDLKAGWVGARQREFHQGTRGIMSHEDRQVLEDEFDRKLAQIQAEAWGRCEEMMLEHIERNGTSTAGWPANPYRKGQGND